MISAARYTDPRGSIRIGAVRGDRIHDAGEAGPRGFIPTDEAWAALDAAVTTEGIPLDSVSLLAPVRPDKLLCVGLNYAAHAREAGLEPPAAPLIFSKLPSALVGPGDAIVLPPGESRPDYEAEVAVVISQQARSVPAHRALKVIGGITAFNDVSGRDAQFADGQWMRGKSFDTFAPIGPVIIRAAGVDLNAIGVRCTLSGEVMQESSTADLIFSIPALIEYISAQFTLEPGDVIATGTPSGVGYAMTPPRVLRDGDVVEVWVEGVGTLTNPVREAVA